MTGMWTLTGLSAFYLLQSRLKGFPSLMYHVTIYIISWVVLLFLVIVERRSLWVRDLLSPFCFLFHRYGFVFGVVDRDFQGPELLHLPFLVLMLASNLLTVLLSVRTDQEVSLKLAEVILMNMSVLFLLSSRHSLFLELAFVQQPGYLWLHRIAGSITMAEIVVFSALRCRGSYHPLYLQ